MAVLQQENMSLQPAQSEQAGAGAERHYTTYGKPDRSGGITVGIEYNRQGDVVPWALTDDSRILAFAADGSLFYVEGRSKACSWIPSKEGTFKPYRTELPSLDSLPSTELGGEPWRVPGLPYVNSPILIALELEGKQTKTTIQSKGLVSRHRRTDPFAAAEAKARLIDKPYQEAGLQLPEPVTQPHLHEVEPPILIAEAVEPEPTPISHDTPPRIQEPVTEKVKQHGRPSKRQRLGRMLLGSVAALAGFTEKALDTAITLYKGMESDRRNKVVAGLGGVAVLAAARTYLDHNRHY